ncbi:MAG: hypothetical protein ACFBSF_16700 [Leptolyngbyaceae cyanobacterium]
MPLITMTLSRTFPWLTRRKHRLSSFKADARSTPKRLQVQTEVKSEVSEFCRAPRQMLKVVNACSPLSPDP